MTRSRVLVTDADSTKALAVVRALGASMEVWTTSGTRLPLAAWSRYARRHVVCPTEPPRDFAQRLLEVCIAHGVRVVVTPEERSSYLVALARDAFDAAGVVLTVAPREALDIVMDKARTIAAARAAGVPVPRTAAISELSDAIPAARALGYPIVVKPRFSHYWTGQRFVSTDGVRYASTEGELLAALDAMPKNAPFPLFQEFVPGRGLGIFLFIGEGGVLRGEFAHERLRDLRPTGSGSVLRRSVAVDPRLRDLALRLLRQIGWRGAAMVEFRGDAGAEPKLMEINGRLWGSLQLATDAGVNFPRLLVDDALGQANGTAPYRTGVIVRWWLGDLVRLMRVFQGPPPGYTGAFPSRRAAMREFFGSQPPGTRQEILRRDDPLPAIGEIVAALSRRRER